MDLSVLTLAQDADYATLLDTKNLIPIAAIVFGCTVAIVAIIFTTLTALAKARARENSRREIAAYVAEGSLTPDQGVALMEAGRSSLEEEIG